MELGPDDRQEPFTKEVLCARLVVLGRCFVFSVGLLQDAVAFVNTVTLGASVSKIKVTSAHE